MAAVVTLYQSSVGKKVVMAVTGLVLVGFVIGHMVGNLKVFMGPAHFDAYAEGLREMGEPFLARNQALLMVRLVLLASVVGHIWSAWLVTKQDWAARPSRYQVKRSVAQGYAARTMRWGGVILALFIVYHLLHLTAGVAHPSFREGQAYANVISGFRQWWVAAFYIVAMLALGLHLHHGVWSMMQTLGANDSSRNGMWRTASAAIAVFVTVGFIIVPVAVLIGIVR
jgi:succinate dehydrogenase / fumarate reductase cytochrome b subunit